jgi:hypothetical protein
MKILLDLPFLAYIGCKPRVLIEVAIAPRPEQVYFHIHLGQATKIAILQENRNKAERSIKIVLFGDNIHHQNMFSSLPVSK